MDVYRWPVPSGTETSQASPLVALFVGQNLDADWSPDGRAVVYVSRRGEVPFTRRSMSLMIRDLATGHERRFTPEADGVHDPRWAPDGTHVVFNLRVGSVDRLQLLSIADGAIREISPVAAWMLPAWSRDGARLYGAAGHDGRFGIRVRDLSTGHESELAWPVNMAFAVSHDERWLASTLDENDGPALSIRAAAGGPWRQVLAAPPGGRVFAIGWTPDDSTLLSWRRTGLGTDTIATEIWATPVLNGVPGPSSRLAVLAGFPDARKFRLSPDGRELLFTAGSTGFSTWQMKGIE
jgi:dipeptidyl aminopeptidase/acylaminoacyl peptidase